MIVFSVWAILVICGVYGEEQQQQQIQTVLSTPNPFLQNRKPLIPGYNPNFRVNDNQVPILSYSSNQDIDGSYSFSFATGDGKQAQETGYLKDAFVDNVGEPQATQVKEGSYSYVSPDGTPIAVNYVADEKGFRTGGVQFSTDGRGAVPTPLVDGVRGPYNPGFNPFGPYNRNNYLGQNNNFNNYDPRYPFDPRNRYDPRYPNDPKFPFNQRFNPYRPGFFNNIFNQQNQKPLNA